MKILFLEDRPSRQEIFLPKGQDDVNTIKSLEGKGLNMPSSEKCKNIINQINNGKYDFAKDMELIIVHKSAIDTRGLDYINKFCEENKVKVVCFSGGIPQVTYNNDGYEFLNVNSTDFYSIRLIPFLQNVLEDKSETVLELANKEWKLSYMLLARQLIENLSIEKDEDSKFNFLDKLDEINKILGFDFSIELKNIDRLNKKINEIIISV